MRAGARLPWFNMNMFTHTGKLSKAIVFSKSNISLIYALTIIPRKRLNKIYLLKVTLELWNWNFNMKIPFF